ncbi:MAG: hypothetical protein ACJ76N_25085 [Thermoanaerobaculia bacterium]
MSNALDDAGYNEKSYYSVPDGFALVSRLEQIDADGTSKPLPARWAADVGPLQNFSLNRYLQALFTANPGFFRVLVFVVTPHPFSQTKVKVQREEAMEWLSAGLNQLPEEIGGVELSSRYSCTALIYEFEQPRSRGSVVLKRPSHLTGQIHLQKAKLWNAMRGTR